MANWSIVSKIKTINTDNKITLVVFLLLSTPLYNVNFILYVNELLEVLNKQAAFIMICYIKHFNSQTIITMMTKFTTLHDHSFTLTILQYELIKYFLKVFMRVRHSNFSFFGPEAIFFLS